MTVITVIDRPCGIGKTNELIDYLKALKNQNIKEKFLLVVPELGEVQRFQDSFNIGYFEVPQANGGSKTDSLIDILVQGRNAIITHALYERIRQFEHLLADYCVFIDEVPTVAQQVHTMFGSGVFYNLLYKKKYIKIHPDTQLITATAKWLVDESQYQEGTDMGISKFMSKIRGADIYYIKGTYCLMPLPDAFFTKPKSLTILTFLFTGTQLDYYMQKRGYKYSLQTCPNELTYFKYLMNSLLYVLHKTTPIRAGYEAMTSKSNTSRRVVGNFIKNTIQTLNAAGFNFTPDNILVAASKDAWFGKEENTNSKVTNATSLKRLTRLGKAAYTGMVTRGTNKFKDRNILINMGKVNMNNDLAEFLGMNTKKAKDRHTLNELIQLIYRTGIRDGKETFFISADADNVRLLKEFLN